MSEPKLISPLLANHIMGEPISDRHGIRCCPALTKDTEEKYIVKIVSLPASQVRLDALLLTGICRNEEDAREYFRKQADAIASEAQLLQKLSHLEGFHSFEAWQIEPMDDEIGFDVYLLGKYRPTLAKQLQQKTMTHLSAVNLGLDLCAALSLCRRNGYLYVNLKPDNIYITENKEFRIADLGFVSLDSLGYFSLPEKYRSAYTAPEITDAYSTLNTTVDIYAAGLILYQAFNGGLLPDLTGELTPPAYADYDMTAIILKACAASCEERWQDPQEMGQALISYLQTNTVNDTPLIPAPEPENAEVGASEEDASEAEESEVQDTEEQASEPETAEAEESETPQVLPEEQSEDTPATAEQTEESQPAFEEPVEETEKAEEDPPVAEEETPPAPKDELEEIEQFVIDGFVFDDPNVPGEEDPFSEEVNQMLAQADDLIAHKAPDPVVAPEPIDVPMPEPIIIEPEPEPEPEAETEETDSPAEDQKSSQEDEDSASDAAAVPDLSVEEPLAKPKTNRRKLGGLICTLVIVLLVLALGMGGYVYYENYYLQNVQDVSVEVDEDRATVTLDTTVDNTLLTVVCTDIYGNSRQEKVENNTAVFTTLNAGTSYRISLLIDGHHKLTGTTTATFSTAAQTNIVSFTAIAGDSDGSVILNFSVQGPDSESWYVYYSTDGEPEQIASCTGHMAVITGLRVGSTYTFRLVPESDLYIVGSDSLEYTALPVIYAQNLAILGYDNGKLIVSWTAPEGITVESWTVRCYNTDGYDYTATVTEPGIALEGLDPAVGYTVDVKAAGMTVSKWTSITANSITFKELLIDDSVPGALTLTWSYEGVAPENGWQLLCTVNGTESTVISCAETTAAISPLIPGAQYSFSFILPAEITAFGGTAQYQVPFAQFDLNGVTSADFVFRMCWTPENENWRWYYLWEQDFTNTFLPGERASFVVYADAEILPGQEQLQTLFIIRNSDGAIVSMNVGKTLDWQSMWDQNYTELDMPYMPQTVGEYTVEIYFSQQYVICVPFTVAAEAAEE